MGWGLYARVFTNVSLKLLPLQGDLFVNAYNPGRCPGLGASALYLSLRPVTVGSGRVGQSPFKGVCMGQTFPWIYIHRITQMTQNHSCLFFKSRRFRRFLICFIVCCNLKLLVRIKICVICEIRVTKNTRTPAKLKIREICEICEICGTMNTSRRFRRFRRFLICFIVCCNLKLLVRIKICVICEIFYLCTRNQVYTYWLTGVKVN